MVKVVGISEMQLSQQADDVLVTYSLGSCIGVSAYDPEAGIGGMVHCMLPSAKMNPEKARSIPCMFVDTGVAKLLNDMFARGARRNNLVVKVAGGGVMLDDNGVFNIGKRNYTVVRKLLWKNNILIASEDIGGQKSRTLYLHMDDGRSLIKSNGEYLEL